MEALARTVNGSGGPKPRVLQLCGTGDPLRAENAAFAAFVERECPGLDWTYEERPGIHDFDFWDGEIPGMLRFFGLV